MPLKKRSAWLAGFLVAISALGLTGYSIMQDPQSKQAAYETMLAGLYKNTVPAVAVPADSLQSYTVLDTRPAEEFAVSHLPRAQRVGYEDFDLAAVAHLPKDAPILLYCSVGYRSERIGERLQEAGYTRVYNLYGGIFQWANQDRPLRNAEGAATEAVHPYSDEWGIWLTDGKASYQPR